MHVGVVIPQGWDREYAGWAPQDAWARMLALTREAEDLGFESAWLFDHFHTEPEPEDELTFECLTALAAMATATSRIRLGQLVLCAGYRNPALVAKMTGTLDVVSGGRIDLGIGAGWKEDEWVAYGYGFPPLRERLAALRDHLEVITAMLEPGRATYRGEHASVDGAINLPAGLQRPRVPIMVGGNGPNVTWRLASRYADELNLDWASPEEVREWLPVVRSRCEEIGRDPASLRVSVHMNWHHAARRGPRRVDDLAAFREMGLHRVMVFERSAAADPEALAILAGDAAEAGISPVSPGAGGDPPTQGRAGD
jgi:F420-dependent oxidoreductase-like protein